MSFEDQSGFSWSAISRSATAITPQTGGLSTSIKDLINPASSRISNLINKGLFPGGQSSRPKQAPAIGFSGGRGESAAVIADDDWRVRISLGEEAYFFYKSIASSDISNNIQSPLLETSGVIWPYTPQVTVTHSASYTPAAPVHSNYPVLFYSGSEVADINISGEFTVQSIEEGQYMLAVIYFLRSCTKMFFGQGQYAGNPPPVVFLNGYGSHYFPNIPCVITSFNHTMPNDVDYIQIPISSQQLIDNTKDASGRFRFSTADVTDQWSDAALQPNGVPGRPNAGVEIGKTTYFGDNAADKKLKTITSSTRLPTSSTISVTVKPIYSRNKLFDEFDLEKFASGDLLLNRTPGSGGFI